MAARTHQPARDESRSAGASGTAGAPIAERRRLCDCRRQPGVCRRARSCVPRRGEEMDACGDRLRAVGLLVLQAERRPRGGGTFCTRSDGPTISSTTISRRPSAIVSARRSSGTRSSSPTTSRSSREKRSSSRRTTTSFRRPASPSRHWRCSARALEPNRGRGCRARHHRANQLLSPDGHYYEGMEYWIFAAPWLVQFYDAWQHSTGESLWELGPARNWKFYLAHALLPDGQNVFDFGDVWEGPLTRAHGGAEYDRVFPGGTLQSNFNLLYRVAAKFHDADAQAVAERYATFGHSNLEEDWTLLWRDPALQAAPMHAFPLSHYFEDMGVVYFRTSWGSDATAFAFKAGPPEGHRAARLRTSAPEWQMDSGHSHPDNGSFIIWANGRYLTGDTGYAGQPHARHHNTITVGGVGQGTGGGHDVWRGMPYDALDGIRIASVETAPGSATIDADLAAAYPAPAGVRELRRTFAFTAPGTFQVSDTIALDSPRQIEWYLQSDTPTAKTGDSLTVGHGLRVTMKLPLDAVVKTEKTMLTAPGRPGSITEGPSDQRGYHLRIETAPAVRTAIVTSLVIEPPH